MTPDDAPDERSAIPRSHSADRPHNVWWYEAIAQQIRNEQRPDDEGCVWLLFADEDHEVRCGAAFGPGSHELDAVEYDSLAHIVDDLDLPAVVIAVIRRDGEPLAADWRLWEEFRGRVLALTRCELIDLLVVGESAWWAVLGGRSHRAA